LLLTYGADVDKGRTDGMNPLLCACWGGEPAMVSLLLRYNPNMNAVWRPNFGSDPQNALLLAHSRGPIGVPITSLLWEHINRYGLIIELLPPDCNNTTNSNNTTQHNQSTTTHAAQRDSAKRRNTAQQRKKHHATTLRNTCQREKSHFSRKMGNNITQEGSEDNVKVRPFLPREIWLEVLAQLPIKDALTCALVNHAWQYDLPI
jgi:hypothetical protein